jgi:hypothetical protein
MHPRRAVALAIAFLPLVVSAPARAWQEVHELGQDFVVRVDSSGVASVEDKVRWRVVRGPLKSLDFGNIDVDHLRDPSVTVTAEDGRPLAAHLVRQDARTFRIVIDEPRAPARGVFAFDLRWQTDLALSHALVKDGATFRLNWSEPPAVDGFDGARTVFDVPAAADPPEAIVPETGLVDDGAVASLRRDPGRDVLELTRPHVSHGESVGWTVRLDARALDARAFATSLSRDTEAAPPIALAEEDRFRGASILAGLLALAVAFGWLVAAKSRAVATAAAAHGARARALLPLPKIPDALRAISAGTALAVGVALQTLGDQARPTLGGLCVAFAAIAAAQRSPLAKPRVRGPGRWVVLRPSEAFGGAADRCHGNDLAMRVRLDALDAGTARGRVALLAVIAIAIAGALVLARFAVEAAWIFAMDAGVLLPIWLTGSVVQLPPYGSGAVAPWLVRAFRRLRATPALRAAPWGRLALDGAIDEIRVLVLPRACMPGVVGIEVGQAWCSTPVGWASVPELLVRVTDGSAAAAKLAQMTSALKEAVFVGRKPDERVVRLVPRGPAAGGAVALVRAVAAELTERRAAGTAGASADARDGSAGVPPAASAVGSRVPSRAFDGEDRRGRVSGHPGLGPNVLEPRASAHGA